MIVIIDLPRSQYQPIQDPPALTWLALALALALAGLALALLLTVTGFSVIAALNLAILAACSGLGLTQAVAYLETKPCYANNWAGV
jgi:hypothetical protein